MKKIAKLCNRRELQKFFKHKVRRIISWRPYSLLDTMEDLLVLREPLHLLLEVDVEPPAEERFADYEASNLYKLNGSFLLQILVELHNIDDARQVSFSDCYCLHLFFVSICSLL
jgi:hypothetical protein